MIYGKKVMPSKNRRIKKDTMFIEVKKDDGIEKYNGEYEVIKKVRRFGKYYLLVKRELKK